MNTLQWTDALLLDYEPMDRVHRDFVELLERAEAASDDALPQAWAAVVDHTAEHFGREDQWMRSTRFAAAEQHMLQHRVVLNLLREGMVMARAGQLAGVREMARELGAWFAKHAQSQDAALALHLRREPRPAASRRATGTHGNRAAA